MDIFEKIAMRTAYVIFCLLFISISLQAQDISSQLNNYLTGSRKQKPFNGTALVIQKGKILLYKGYGYSNVESKKPNDTGTIYRIGSLTKPFTATVILHLESEKMLSTHDPLSKYFPNFQNSDLITIEHLLTHSSGIKDYLEVKAVQQLPDSAPPISMTKLISFFENEPLTIKPGEKFAYSNSNYILLAAIAEKVAGQKFEHLVRRIVFDPLEMKSSGFDFKNLTDSNKSTGYIGKKDNIVVEDFDSTYAPGCGSMYSTAMDLYRWYRGLYGSKVIGEATRELAFTPRQWKYGYGWFRYELYGKKCISHAGGVPGFLAQLQFFPDDDLCIILLSNNNAIDIVAQSEKLASIVFQKPYQSSGL